MARVNSFGASGIMTTSFDVNQCDYARKEVAYKMGQENGVVKLIFLALAPICVLLGGPAAQAQVSLDVSKITCDQFTGYKASVATLSLTLKDWMRTPGNFRIIAC